MNSWQVLNQIKYLLQQARWEGTSTVIFAPESVKVVGSDSDVDAIDARPVLPMALIVPESGTADPQHGEESGYMARNISIVLVTRNENDRLGMAGIMGANREGISDSRGRGVLEFEGELFRAIKQLVINSGVNIAFKGNGSSATRKDADDIAYAIQEYQFEAFCTTALEYFPGRKLAAQPRTGEVSLSWAVPPARYDRYRMVLRRAAGSTAPTSISSGTGVTLASAMATSVVDSGLAAGTYSYALFCTYDDMCEGVDGQFTPAQDLRASDSVTATVTAF